MESREYWDKRVKLIVFLCNVTPIKELTKSPFELMYGRRANVPVGLEKLPTYQELATQDPIDVWETRQQIQRENEGLTKGASESWSWGPQGAQKGGGKK